MLCLSYTTPQHNTSTSYFIQYLLPVSDRMSIPGLISLKMMKRRIDLFSPVQWYHHLVQVQLFNDLLIFSAFSYSERTFAVFIYVFRSNKLRISLTILNKGNSVMFGSL